MTFKQGYILIVFFAIINTACYSQKRNGSLQVATYDINADYIPYIEIMIDSIKSVTGMENCNLFHINFFKETDSSIYVFINPDYISSLRDCHSDKNLKGLYLSNDLILIQSSSKTSPLFSSAHEEMVLKVCHCHDIRCPLIYLDSDDVFYFHFDK